MLGARSYRKRPLFRAPSPNRDQLSPVSVASRSSKVSSGSGASKRSRSHRKSLAATLASRKSYASLHSLDGLGIVQGKCLKIREWLLILIEIFISFAAWVISERNNNVEELIRVGLTARENAVYMLYWQGWAAFGSWFAGVLADSYVGHYNLALFSVGLHFAVVSIVFMEDTIKGNQKGNPYAQLVWNITAVSTLFLRSTDFTRVVFGLEGMGNKNKSAVMLFIFLITWTSARCSNGGLIRNITGYLRSSVHIKLSFVTTGICVYIFLYFLHPEAKLKENCGIGVRVMRCIILACLLKFKHSSRRKKKGWLDTTEGKCDKTTIGKAKQLLFVYAVMLPTIGFSFYVEIDPFLFHHDVFDCLSPNWLAQILGVFEYLSLIYITSSAVSFFVILRLLRYFDFWKSVNRIYLLGYFVGVCSVFYAAIVFSNAGIMRYSSASGIVRVFNTASQTVTFQTEGESLSSTPHRVKSHEGIMVSYALDETTLFMTDVRYESAATNISMFLSITPGTATGYVILDPPDMVRIPGALPIREGPPGTNTALHPRLYLFNLAEILFNSWLTITKNGQHQVLKRYQLIPISKLTVFNLIAGVYDFSVKQADIKTTKRIEDGGIYAIITYSNSTSRSIIIDEVKKGNTVSDSLFLPEGIMFGISFAFAYVGLRAIIYSIAPPGLMGMSFSYISSLESLCSWIFYIGLQTWHQINSTNAYFTYAFSISFCFFASLYFFIKYRNICDF